MNWKEIPPVALADLHSRRHKTILALLLPHGHQHIKEGVWALFDLATANRWKKESVELINIGGSSVDFPAVPTSEVLFSFSVLDVAGANDCALDNHEFVHMRLS